MSNYGMKGSVYLKSDHINIILKSQNDNYVYYCFGINTYIDNKNLFKFPLSVRKWFDFENHDNPNYISYGLDDMIDENDIIVPSNGTSWEEIREFYKPIMNNISFDVYEYTI